MLTFNYYCCDCDKLIGITEDARHDLLKVFGVVVCPSCGGIDFYFEGIRTPIKEPPLPGVRRSRNPGRKLFSDNPKKNVEKFYYENRKELHQNIIDMWKEFNEEDERSNST